MIEIGGIQVGEGEPCRLVAEISNNHNGSEDRAVRLIEAAKEAGADFVKFQCYTPDELVELRGDGRAPEPWGSAGHTMRSLYERARTPFEWFPGLFYAARTLGLVPFSSVFGLDSLDVLEAVDCPAYKIARMEEYSYSFAQMVIRRACSLGKPTIASVNDTVKSAADFNLCCPPGYPQTEWNFTEFPYPRQGFSYHGTDWNVPARAVACGAQMVEFHFHLEAEPSELEADVSLNERDVAHLAAYNRDVYALR